MNRVECRVMSHARAFVAVWSQVALVVSLYLGSSGDKTRRVLNGAATVRLPRRRGAGDTRETAHCIR